MVSERVSIPDLLWQLYQVLQKQGMALICRDVNRVLELSAECSRLCRCINERSEEISRLAADQDDSDWGSDRGSDWGSDWRVVRQLARACKVLEEKNTNRLKNLSLSCETLINSWINPSITPSKKDSCKSSSVYHPTTSVADHKSCRTLLKV